MNTITFREFDNKGSQVVPLQKMEDIPAGCEIAFSMGVDDNTRQARRYTAVLQPGAKTGSWESGDLKGELENVARTDNGTEHTITGIWVEGGRRQMFEVFFWK